VGLTGQWVLTTGGYCVCFSGHCVCWAGQRVPIDGQTVACWGPIVTGGTIWQDGHRVWICGQWVATAGPAVTACTHSGHCVFCVGHTVPLDSGQRVGVAGGNIVTRSWQTRRQLVNFSGAWHRVCTSGQRVSCTFRRVRGGPGHSHSDRRFGHFVITRGQSVTIIGHCVSTCGHSVNWADWTVLSGGTGRHRQTDSVIGQRVSRRGHFVGHAGQRVCLLGRCVVSSESHFGQTVVICGHSVLRNGSRMVGLSSPGQVGQRVSTSGQRVERGRHVAGRFSSSPGTSAAPGAAAAVCRGADAA
jgi:hypothetical protein